jgi:hypothetical protein
MTNDKLSSLVSKLQSSPAFDSVKSDLQKQIEDGERRMREGPQTKQFGEVLKFNKLFLVLLNS